MAKTRARIAPVSDTRAQQDAIRLWQAGDLVSIPTETVYGLAGDATNPDAIGKIYSTKARPAHNPLICHVASQEMAESLADFDATARLLCTAFWPGPLTLVLPLKTPSLLAPAVTAGLDSVALRMPAQDEIRTLIDRLGRPLAAPSANPSGRLSPTSAHDVFIGLGEEISLILDGGTTDFGIESTIVRVQDGAILVLRPGAISDEDLVAAVGAPLVPHSATDVVAPGMLASHYAPHAPVRLNADTARDDEVLIGFGPGQAALNLSPAGDLKEAAHNLFALLRKADDMIKSSMAGRGIAVAPIPEHGLGAAINDRLRRAAAPRPAERTPQQTHTAHG